MSADDSKKPLPPAPPGWNTWRRTFRIEAQLGLVRDTLEALRRHLRERPVTGPKPGFCAYTCLGYAVFGLVFMFSAPWLLKRGTWAGDLFDSVGIKNWGYLALAGLVAAGIHSFRPRPGEVDMARLVALQSLLETLGRGPLSQGPWEDARWDLELNLTALESTSARDEWKHSSDRHERIQTYEQRWLRLEVRGAEGRALRLELESERVERDVHHERTRLDGSTKLSTSEKDPRFRHVLRGRLEAKDPRIDLAARALDARRTGRAEPKDPLEQGGELLRVTWVCRGRDLAPALDSLVDLAEGLAAGAP